MSARVDPHTTSPDVARFRPGVTKGFDFGTVRVAVGADDWGKPRWPEMSAVLCGDGVVALRSYTRADEAEWKAALAEVERRMMPPKPVPVAGRVYECGSTHAGLACPRDASGNFLPGCDDVLGHDASCPWAKHEACRLQPAGPHWHPVHGDLSCPNGHGALVLNEAEWVAKNPNREYYACPTCGRTKVFAKPGRDYFAPS